MYRACWIHTRTLGHRARAGAGAFVAVAALQTLYRPREPRGTGVPRGREGPPRAAGRSRAAREVCATPRGLLRWEEKHKQSGVRTRTLRRLGLQCRFAAATERGVRATFRGRRLRFGVADRIGPHGHRRHVVNGARSEKARKKGATRARAYGRRLGLAAFWSI